MNKYLQTSAMAFAVLLFPNAATAQTINGDHTISAGTTLTEDLTVTGTLTIGNGATIDLQGHKLTVGGLANNSQNLVANGSFENYEDKTDQTAHPGHNYGYLQGTYYAYFDFYDSIAQAGPVAIKDWDCTKETSDETHAGLAHNNINSHVPDGNYVLFFHGTKRSIKQTVDLPADGLYALSLQHATRNTSTYSGGHIEIDIGYKTGLVAVDCTTTTASPADCVVELSAGEQTFKIRQTGTKSTTICWVDNVVLRQIPLITDTNTGAPGELRLMVPDGSTFDNSDIAIDGNLNFIKDGSGSFTCAKDGLMTYSGEMFVENGKYICGLDGSQHPFGGKNLLVNGDFDADPMKLDGRGVYTFDSWTYYNTGGLGTDPQFQWEGWGNGIGGGGLTKSGGMASSSLSVGKYAAFLFGPGDNGNPNDTKVKRQHLGRYLAQEIATVPAGEYMWSFKYASRNSNKIIIDFLLEKSDGTVLENLETLTIQQANTTPWKTASGTATIPETGTYTLKFKINTSTPYEFNNGAIFDDVVFEPAGRSVHVANGAAIDLNGKGGFGGYKFIMDDDTGGTLLNSGADYSGDPPKVSGRFRPESPEAHGFHYCELQDGSKLDLRNWPAESWPAAIMGGEVAQPLSFASGAAIEIVLDPSRRDLRTLAKSDNPYILSWSAKPDASFALDSASKARGYKIESGDTGLKIMLNDGFHIFLR